MTYLGRPVEIDREIAPLLREVWRAGLGTDGCCQGKPDEEWVWIAFTTADDAARFLDIVSEVYERSPVYWPLTAIESWKRGTPPRPRFQFAISLRFPRRDYKLVLLRMREHNRRAKRNRKERAKP